MVSIHVTPLVCPFKEIFLIFSESEISQNIASPSSAPEMNSFSIFSPFLIHLTVFIRFVCFENVFVILLESLYCKERKKTLD